MPHSSFELIKFHSVSKSYGPKNVLTDVTFSLSRGERFALIGENGSGKTTIAHLIASIQTPDQGKVWVSPLCKIGYLPQDSLHEEDRNLTLKDFLLEAQGGLQRLSKRLNELETLMALLPSGVEMEKALAEWDLLFKEFSERNGYEALERAQICLKTLQIDSLSSECPLCQLSEGERRRVCLAGILLQEPDVLILDEPTNHLDNKALEWLEGYLGGFAGAVLLITHDRYFLNQTATAIMELASCQLRHYTGNYEGYLEAKEKERSNLLKGI